MSMKNTHFKKALSLFLAVVTVLSCWVWVNPAQTVASAANETVKDHYLFAYFTGTSKDGQTIHLAVSEDGYNYTALRNNEPVIIPSKGVGCVRDPYIWYNEQDNYYYILATDLDFTDGGGTYSNNSQSFIVWRSKDLVNWYDETFIDVSKMAHLIGDTRNMSAVWAPQVLWDGSAYVVYFTLACNATSWFDIVYLKTTDLMDPNAYYEFDYILGNSTGNGVDNGYGNIDADIIHNPKDGKYYLFYKVENHDTSLGTDSNNSAEALRKIFYYVGDTATGPFTNPGDTLANWDNAGYSLWPDAGYSLEGCNAFWDNDGNLIVYADEYAHKNSLGEDEAYFHIAKSNGYDFTSWTYPDVSQHNINSLSPRHGSVVKITADEYNRLLNNSYNVSSSSFSDTETLEDHLVAQYFTTEDGLWNNVIGQPNLDGTQSNIKMQYSDVYGWYAYFDGTTNYATVDFDSLFLKTNGLNYHDGFTITFSAWNFPMESENSENNDRIYEIADVFGSRTGTEHYTHFSPSGGGTGSYLGNYNGPVDSGNDWLADKDGANRDDNCMHDYVISYATGNVMVYVDGELVISRNRFTGVTLDASWYEALGSNATMRIGKSGWDADPLFNGYMQNLCIYDCSMSYYDATSMTDSYKEDLGWVEAENYTGITSVVPTFQNTDAARMQSIPNASEHFSNILYTSETVKNYDGNNMSSDSAVWYFNNNDFYFALYYPETTVLLLDGVNDAIMPVSFGAYCTNSRDSKGFLQIYPTTGPGSTADLGELEISQNWGGWYNNGDYYECVVSHADGYIGRNSTTSSWSHITDKKNYDCHWGAPLKVNNDNIDFGDSYYKKFNLTWQVNGGTNGTIASDHCANMTSDNDIYVINFKPILELRESITETEYNEIMNNSYLCPELKTKYAAAVYEIRTMNPNNFGFTESPITATQACAKAISEAVGTYEGVMAEIAREEASGNYGHQPTTFEAREATCAVNGLTSGSYCVLCGEVLEEQEVLATLPHTFGDVYTENGVQYRECTVCGVILEYKPYEVRYENLFSLNRWADSDSDISPFGTNAVITTDLINGHIKIVNNYTDEVYSSATYDGANLAATRNFNNDCIPVTGGQSYVVEATSLASSTSNGDVFVFQYTKDGLVYQAIPACIGGLAPGETRYLEFTVDINAAYIELRFDANDAGKTITFSQIGVYEKEEFDKFGKDTADARLGYYPGDDKALCYPNPSDGYTFDGWYTSSGVKIENVNQLNTSTNIVYGKWIPAGFDVTYDSIFSFSAWAKSSCNQLWYGDVKNDDGSVTRLVSPEGIIADAENGTITITNDADTTYFARTNYWVYTDNLYKMTVEPNTDYVIEYTATSDDGAKPNVVAYFTGGTASYPETGQLTSWNLGTQRVTVNSGEGNTSLSLRFDNPTHGSTITYSNIAVYRADMFLDHAQNITNREYRRYYPQKMGIGDVFEYIPERPGYTFKTWLAETNLEDDQLGDFDMAGFDDTFLVQQNWQLFSDWTENSYTIAYDANGGSGSVASQTVTYTQDVTLASSGFTRNGYTLKGWSTVPSATVALYQLGQTTNRLCGDADGTVTLYAVWEEVNVNVTFDNLFDFSEFTIGGNLTVNERTDTGFTVTSTAEDGNTGFSNVIPVESGKTYIFSADVSIEQADGDVKGFDMYINTLDSSRKGETTATPDTSNGAHTEGDVYISLTGQKTNGTPYIRFTAGSSTAYIKIRFDANTAGNKLTVNNIRVYEDTGVTVSPVNKSVSYLSEYGTLPTPTKDGYDFLGWFTADNTQVTSTTVMESVTTVNLYSHWEIGNSALKADTYVLDYGLKAQFKPLGNDDVLTVDATEYSIVGIGAEDSDTYSSEVKGAYGTFTLSENVVTYTPNKIIDSNAAVEVINYYVKATVDGTEKTLCNTISVIPASVVYYEDDMEGAVTYTNGKASSGTTGTWSTTGSSSTSSVYQSVADDVYGYDAVYADSATYSMGSAYKVSVSAKNNPKGRYNGGNDGDGSWPVAEFTFAGTGFDIVSLISNETGTIEVKVFKGSSATGELVKDWIVDTYYGYSYNEDTKEWEVTDKNGTLYQIPVISRTDLDYGTYTVQIIPTYTSRLDHTGNSSYDFYLDAIRVYDPTGACADNNDYVAEVYAAAGEYTVYEKAVRDILIDAKDLDVTDDTTTGIVYINKSIPSGDYAEYSSKGPKNEVYLAKDQSIAFNITVDKIPSKVLVSAHAPNGTAAAMRFANTKGSYSDAVSVSSTTTLYFAIPSSLINWNQNTDGTYTTANPIIINNINNNGDGLLSICNIKCVSDTVTQTAVSFSLRRSSLDDVSDVIDTVSELSPEDEGLFVADSVEVETDADDVVIAGNEVNVTVTTSADVAAVTVNGENATLVSENEDGTKTWSFAYGTSRTSGTETITLVAYNSDGIASEETTLTVEVETAVEHFFNKLVGFIKAIVEFIQKVFNSVSE